MAEDGHDGGRVGEEGQDAHLGAAAGAAEGRDLVDAGDEARPAGASGAAGGVRGSGRGGIRRTGSGGRPAFDSGGLLRHGSAEIGCALLEREGSRVLPGQRHHAAPEVGIGRENAVVAMTVDAGWRDQAGEGGQEVQGGEGQDIPAVGQRSGGEEADESDGARLCWAGLLRTSVPFLGPAAGRAVS